MMIVKLHCDGWVALPSAARAQLGRKTSAELRVEILEDRIVLRRSKGEKAVTIPRE